MADKFQISINLNISVGQVTVVIALCLFDHKTWRVTTQNQPAFETESICGFSDSFLFVHSKSLLKYF